MLKWHKLLSIITSINDRTSNSKLTSLKKTVLISIYHLLGTLHSRAFTCMCCVLCTHVYVYVCVQVCACLGVCVCGLNFLFVFGFDLGPYFISVIYKRVSVESEIVTLLHLRTIFYHFIIYTVYECVHVCVCVCVCLWRVKFLLFFILELFFIMLSFILRMSVSMCVCV